MLDTSQSYLPLRRGSSEDGFEQSPPFLEKKQQRSPPTRWKEVLLIISGVTNIAALCIILSYLFFSTSPPAGDCPATTKCSAATTAYPQTSYSKQKPCRPSRREGGGGSGVLGEGVWKIWEGRNVCAIMILTLYTHYVSGNSHISWKMAAGNMVVNVQHRARKRNGISRRRMGSYGSCPRHHRRRQILGWTASTSPFDGTPQRSY